MRLTINLEVHIWEFNLFVYVLVNSIIIPVSQLFQLLDDNRELFIPETQETVKAHPQFMLFATQNPPGQYGGRKVQIDSNVINYLDNTLSHVFVLKFVVKLHFLKVIED